MKKWFNQNSIKIGFINYKGGVGKSTLSFQVAKALDVMILDIDTYGNMASRYDAVVAFEQGEKVVFPDTAFVADFGGYAHEDEEELLAQLDLIIVPFTTDDDSTIKTMDTLLSFADTETPVLLLANNVVKADTKKVKEILGSLDGILEYGFDITYVNALRGIKTATDAKEGVVDRAKVGDFRASQLKASAKAIEKLLLGMKDIIIESKKGM